MILAFLQHVLYPVQTRQMSSQGPPDEMMIMLMLKVLKLKLLPNVIDQERHDHRYKDSEYNDMCNLVIKSCKKTKINNQPYY